MGVMSRRHRRSQRNLQNQRNHPLHRFSGWIGWLRVAGWLALAQPANAWSQAQGPSKRREVGGGRILFFCVRSWTRGLSTCFLFVSSYFLDN